MARLPEQTNQQAQAPQRLRKNMQAELDASKQAIQELTAEDLELVSGGNGFTHFFKSAGNDIKNTAIDVYDKAQPGIKGASRIAPTVLRDVPIIE